VELLDDKYDDKISLQEVALMHHPMMHRGRRQIHCQPFRSQLEAVVQELMDVKHQQLKLRPVADMMPSWSIEAMPLPKFMF
jgi:hypothetical protein